ncbi:transposase [Pectinatus frisingensis]|uniref:transposase n=1 Tax=Pectinatus frisingensis TaxID=865 RepID=UPI0018C83069|nr:transposase [Pectinatus frisingensis]
MRRKSIKGLSIHSKYHSLFGVRWLLQRLSIYPNAYYNFLKDRKAAYKIKKQQALEAITKIYHEHHGVDGYRTMRIYLKRKNIYLSNLTGYKYMNHELRLLAVVRRKKPNYKKGHAHKIFPNLVNQDFSAKKSQYQMVHRFYLFISYEW